MMFLRDNPAPLGFPALISKFTFVATTISSRLSPNSRINLPVIVSLLPSWYTFAVSKKLMPNSIALRKIGFASSNSIAQGNTPFSEPDLPKLIIPKHMRETSTPLLPSFTYFIKLSLLAKVIFKMRAVYSLVIQ